MITAKSYIEKTASIASVGAKGVGNVLGGGSTIGGHVVSSGRKGLAGSRSKSLNGGRARLTSGNKANPPKKTIKQNMQENARLSSYKGTGMSEGRKAINNALGNAFGMKNHAL